jgi:hypothetical protein
MVTGECTVLPAGQRPAPIVRAKHEGFTVIRCSVRIPVIATSNSEGSRPLVPLDRDQCGAG